MPQLPLSDLDRPRIVYHLLRMVYYFVVPKSVRSILILLRAGQFNDLISIVARDERKMKVQLAFGLSFITRFLAFSSLNNLPGSPLVALPNNLEGSEADACDTN